MHGSTLVYIHKYILYTYVPGSVGVGILRALCVWGPWAEANFGRNSKFVLGGLKIALGGLRGPKKINRYLPGGLKKSSEARFQPPRGARGALWAIFGTLGAHFGPPFGDRC